MNRNNRSSFYRASVLALSISLALVACGDKTEKEQQEQAAAREAHAPEVGVMTMQPQNVLLENHLSGRLDAIRSAPIVPQVSGIVKRRLFQEGSFVKAGQPLYQLEDDIYGANLASARAALLTAQAQAAKAAADLARYRPLVEADAISRQEYDAALAAKHAADAAVQSAQASIRAAQVNINHARIVAPISGFVGESKVTEGALVNAGSTQMALIQQTNPMYVNIPMTANEMMKLRQQLANQERTLNSDIQVGIILEDGSEYAHKGRLLFVDPTVDASTGQISVRVEVPNPDLILMSGLYVRVQLPLAGVMNAFLVPQQAVTRSGEGKDILMVVTPSGEMQPRPVKITGQKGSDWVVSEGLQAGDKVIVNGTMIAAISGAKKVKPVEWQPEAKAGAQTQNQNDAPQESAPDLQAASESNH